MTFPTYDVNLLIKKIIFPQISLARSLYYAVQQRTLNQGIILMKLIMAVIKPHKLDEVRESLTPLGVEGMTVSEVKGFGRQKGQSEIYRGAEYTVNFLPKVKIEIAVQEDVADQVVETVVKAAQTGKIGDGKVFVYSIDKAVRIRTGETDNDAL